MLGLQLVGIGSGAVAKSWTTERYEDHLFSFIPYFRMFDAVQLNMVGIVGQPSAHMRVLMCATPRI